MKTKKPAIAVVGKPSHHASHAQTKSIHALVEASSPLRIEPRYVGVADAEIISGISKWTWRTMAYDGRVSSSKVGSRLLIPMAEIERVMTENLRPRAERA